MEKQNSIEYSIIFIFLVVIFLTSLYNYLLFHSIAEFISIAIAFSIFFIGLNSKKYLKNNYLLFIAAPYLFIGTLDLLHTLSYPGMNIFTDYDYYANQLWIATRYLESVTLLLAFSVLKYGKPISIEKMFFVYLFISTAIIYSIFGSDIFPVCFIKGKGLTPFKIYSEYIISGILFICIYLLRKNKSIFSDHIYRLLLLSFISTIIAELAFTFYISNYGISNLVGHFFKLFSFYFIYKSIIETGIKEPQHLIFKELNDTQQQLTATLQTKDQLMSIIAHDLKGPIGALNTYFAEINQHFDEYDKNFIKSVLTESENCTRNAYQMLVQTLDWARAQRGLIKAEMAESLLTPIIEEAVQPFHKMAEQKHISVSIARSCDYKAYIDSQLTHTVIGNLLANAIKHCPKNAVIDISCQEGPDGPIVQIKDNGKGIEEARLNTIFDLPTLSCKESHNSTGLGLNICKNFMELQGGSINIHSLPGEGTTVKLVFKKK